MALRMVIVTIDDALRLFKDYVSQEDLPDDAIPVKLMIHPTERKFAIVAESDQWGSNTPPLNIHFDLKRFFGGASGPTNVNL